MFEKQDTPRVFGLPPGADFCAAVIDGLRTRLADQPPEAMAGVEIYVTTARMMRRMRDVFDAGPPGFLPRIKLVSNLADPLTRAKLPKPVASLQRRLELVGLVGRLIDAQPDIAPKSAQFDLADSLAELIDEMSGESVSFETIAGLDVSDASGYWQRALQFLTIAQGFIGEDQAPDKEAYARLALQTRLDIWTNNPPQHPVIVAGSTGSRGTTAEFMRAVANLPQGALIFPGFDYDLPAPVWDKMDSALGSEDHPQYRFARLMQQMDLGATDVPLWAQDTAPDAGRNQVISLALRPAPVTHQWLSEGPNLPNLPDALQDVTLIEAGSPRDEALAIALRLRQAAQDGVRAALITPDRMLSRRVTSALARWNLTPDDSAGMPAQLSPPGRFLRHVARLLQEPLSAEALLTLLKHPLCHSSKDRGPHLLNTRELELHIRKTGWPFPQADKLRAWGEARDCQDWANWVAEAFCDKETIGLMALPDLLNIHIAMAEYIAGAGEGAGGLWDENAGRVLTGIVEDLQEHAAYGPDMNARDYADLFGAIVGKETVRDRDAPHPNVLIWGTLEARVMDADLLILGGLNEASWPEMPSADPWLNRQMRHDAGLLLPERRVGLSAHDFQVAAGAKDVMLSRALKSDEAETVPSRWLNRLCNLVNGLPGRDGPQALTNMRQKGQYWLDLAEAVEDPIYVPSAPRPSPAPPVEARPRQLPVTSIKTLVRDPFAIYAQRILRLRPLDPLQQEPNPLLRGNLVHEMLEAFVKTCSDADPPTPERFMSFATQIIGDEEAVPFPTVRHFWLAQMQAVANWFCEGETARQNRAKPAQYEVVGKADLPALGFTLTAKADRVDIDAAGNAWLYDYKTGTAPTKAQQENFDKQLLLSAAIAQQGGFENLSPRHVLGASFLQMKASKPLDMPAPLEEHPPEKVWEEFTHFIAAYLTPDQGYTARRALMSDKDISDYDQLSRFGEWDVVDIPVQEVLT